MTRDRLGVGVVKAQLLRAAYFSAAGQMIR